ncbi:hypothetical protein [Deinococcus sp. Marseille-Q6407]|uniref:hypothetical protein n=1 Tax=Deinococcus sp. Marseille-Q6407 TaxID=2969223 RepID=UPI0021C1A9DD|nr:hypothetical protein [Deinococcus sp. Marseille-Q6407]
MTTEPVQYIIWNPEGKTPPRVRFDDPARARAEAERLAGAHLGQAFYICQLVSVTQTGPVTTRELVQPEPPAQPAAGATYRIADLECDTYADVFVPLGEVLTGQKLVDAFLEVDPECARTLADLADGLVDSVLRHHEVTRIGAFRLRRLEQS